ncbi:hypothetical protein NX02_18025 [Sphingomonas sanxanigenens DSM 19645 = NX02]|uniref:Uncharacterized protein n=2 Tax=Sphingomonas sanxanigenens TaxID=397260 RepID=W0ABG7_9SPHN|nr:hypothetical protein NX02_18025 [Sphingomonas sanxanigenens DSM 19645 = NX02]
MLTPLLVLGAATQGVSMPTEDPIIAFARDFSGDDAAIVAAAERYLAAPPTDEETIGFYSAGDWPPRHRAFLATVTLLDGKEKLTAVEDKYSYELFALWAEAGVIDPATLPPAAKALFGPLIDGAVPDADAAAYRARAWDSYAQATAELEAHIAARGKALLSVDATDGDTMLFALVAPAIADRWRNRALSEHQGYRAGVRAPMWDRLWAHLAYAMRGALVAEDREGYPPGTPRRVEEIPFAA